MGYAKKIILTGSNGYLGKELQKELRKNKISFCSIGKKRKDLNLNLLDKKSLLKLNTFDEEDLILHCAGFVPKYLSNIILISSFSVYGYNKKADEKVINKKKFENKYLESKIICEKNLINSKKNYLILRLPGLFGNTKKRGLIFNLIKSFIYKKKFKINKNYSVWTCLHVNDAARGIIELLSKKKLKSGIYNLSYNKNYSAQDVITIISKKFQKNIKFDLNERFEISKKYKFRKLQNFEYRIKEEIKNIKLNFKNDKINQS